MSSNRPKGDDDNVMFEDIPILQNDPPVLVLQIATYQDESEIAIRKYSTLTRIKLNELKIIFLKRVINELVEYIKNQLLASFWSQLPNDNNKPENIEDDMPENSRSRKIIFPYVILIFINRNEA